MNNDNGKDKEDEFDAKTFLYIRTNPADDGTPLPAGSTFWISPDITIIRPGGIRGSEAHVGEAETVEVIVTNAGGIDAIDAYVEAFVANPSTGFTPATAKPVGNGFISIPHNNTQAITFPWVPTAQDAGHRCLFARVCLTFPPDCYANATIFDVLGDRHVAQRNINVVSFNSTTISFGFQIVNPIPKPIGQFIINAKEIKVTEENINSIRYALRSKDAQFAQVKLAGIGLKIMDSRSIDEKKSAEVKNAKMGIFSKPLNIGKTRSSKIRMKEGEIKNAVVTLARNPDVRKGDLSLVQIEQIDSETREIVGGLWLVLKN